jgi:hypothetical protein
MALALGLVCRFLRADIRSYPRIGEAPDLALCNFVLQHWANDEIEAWLENLRLARPRFALIMNVARGVAVNHNINTGGFRPIDLTAEPFSVGEVVFSVGDVDAVLVRPEAP